MPLAFSYKRFSSAKQQHGNSEERQDSKYKEMVIKHGLTPATEYFDRGRSGWKKGKQKELQEFLELARAGSIPSGSWLIVENTDRIGRQGFWETTDIIRDILKCGIIFATTTPERILNKQSMGDMREIITIAVDAERAKSESDMKSVRVKSAWRNKLAKGGETLLTKRGPLWLTLDGDKWVENKDRVKTVKLIFKLYTEKGLGARQVCKYLNTNGIESWTGIPWNPTYIGKKILNDSRVIGTLKSSTGVEIPNYYPAIIEEKLYSRVQALTKKRTKLRGNTSNKCSNLFTGLAFDDSGSAMQFQRKHADKSPRWMAIKWEQIRDRKNAVSFPYDVWEEKFLELVTELKTKDIGELEPVSKNQLSNIENEINLREIRIAELSAAMANVNTPIQSITDTLIKLEGERRDLANQLAELSQNQQLTSPNEALNASKTILAELDTLSGEELLDARLQLRTQIRSLVDKIVVQLVKKKSITNMVATIIFQTGKVRQIGMVVKRGVLLGMVADMEKWSDGQPEKIVEFMGERAVISHSDFEKAQQEEEKLN